MVFLSKSSSDETINALKKAILEGTIIKIGPYRYKPRPGYGTGDKRTWFLSNEDTGRNSDIFSYIGVVRQYKIAWCNSMEIPPSSDGDFPYFTLDNMCKIIMLLRRKAALVDENKNRIINR
jgi:hypothetical protein